MKKSLYLGFAALAVAMSLMVSACKDEEDKPAEETFTSVTDSSVANTAASLGLVGTTARSSDTSVATVEIKDNKIAITSKKAGTATIYVETAELSTVIPVTVADKGAITIGTIAVKAATLASVVSLPSSVTNIKSGAGTQAVAGSDRRFWAVDSNGIQAIRDAGGKAITWDHSADTTTAPWKDSHSNVRVDITVEGDAANAYLFAWDGVRTYETIKTGFFGLYNGQPLDSLETVSSLTFAATAAGIYKITFKFNTVNATSYTVGSTLTTKEYTYVVKNS
ncbi:hypothetical protein PilKf_01970 [Pillotina sp. SPG140]|jgi:hypothetical protein